jgi:hypothetical protein
MISERTRAALARSKKKLGGFRGRAGTKADCEKARAAKSAKAAARAVLLGPTIAELRAQGRTSLSAIAAGLNEQAITAPRGGEWRAEQVRQMLSRIPPPS